MSSVHFHIDVVAGAARGEAWGREQFVRARLHINLHHHLPSNRADLNLNVDNTERFGADIDLNQAGINRFVELSEA